MATFLFVRHGEPDYGVIDEWAKIHIARDFAPLTENGAKQIQHTTELLRDSGAEIIITSPFTRCMQGAAIMSKELNLEMIVEPMLYKWLIWQFNHLKRTKWSKWESKENVKDRVYAVLKKYSHYSKVIVSCHAVMLGIVTNDERMYEYGEIKEFDYNEK